MTKLNLLILQGYNIKPDLPSFQMERLFWLKMKLISSTKGVIKETCHEEKEFVSPIFISHKSNGGIRLILNLKQLNKNIKYHHFKMESINTILNLITKDCLMAWIDLKNAYYSVKISENFQRYLKFEFLDRLYKFLCFQMV